MNKGAMTPALLYAHPDKPEWKAAGRLWQGIPAIERTQNGRLYACWYSGKQTEEPGNIVVIEKSDDDGKTWSDGFYVIAHDDPEVRCFDPALWIDPRGRLWLFWTQAWMYYDNRDGVWAVICDDPDAENVVFGELRRLMNGLMLNKPIVTKQGEWLFPAALWSRAFSQPQEDHPELRSEELANVYASLDEGVTFERRGGVDVPDRAFDEHCFVELNDGRLWMTVRTKYGIGQAFSSDGGRTWEGVGPSGHTGPNSRFFVRRLKSGRLLLVNHLNPTYQTRPQDWNIRNNLVAMLSDDDGKTWQGALVLDARDCVSYPDGVQSENGDIYVIYDRDRYGAREILMAVFTEEDVLEGGLVRSHSRLRQLVSRATGEAK